MVVASPFLYLSRTIRSLTGFFFLSFSLTLKVLRGWWFRASTQKSLFSSRKWSPAAEVRWLLLLLSSAILQVHPIMSTLCSFFLSRFVLGCFKLARKWRWKEKGEKSAPWRKKNLSFFETRIFFSLRQAESIGGSYFMLEHRSYGATQQHLEQGGKEPAIIENGYQ